MDVSHRVARLDLGSIGAALAVRILAECDPAIEAEVRRLTPALRHTTGLDADDLRAIGQVAVLEAYLTHGEGRGRTLRSWAGQVVRWRLSEAVQAAQSPESLKGLSVPQEEAVDPFESYDEAERMGWLEREVAGLPPRHRVLVTTQLRGEPQVLVAHTLGIGKSRVSVEIGVAVGTLHARAVDAGLSDE